MKKGRRPRRRPRLKLSDKAGPDQCPVPGENALFPAQIAGFLAVSRPVPVYPVFLNYVVPVQIILDIVDQEEMEQAVKICQSIRLDEQSVKILLLVRPEPAAVRKRAVDTKSAGLADDFVFYDSSLTYLLAKLEAL